MKFGYIQYKELPNKNIFLKNNNNKIMSTPVYKSFIIDDAKVVSKSLEEGQFTYEFVMTKQVNDRSNQVVKISGIDTDNFIKNPIVLFNHNPDQPIGRIVSMRVENDSLIGELEFHKISLLSKEVAEMVEKGYLKTVSIGFLPLKYNDNVITKENRESGDFYPVGSVQRVYEEIELFECSIVTIPANPEAIRQSLEIVEKAGAVLNSTNVTLITTAIDNLNKVLQNANIEIKTGQDYMKVNKALTPAEVQMLNEIIIPIKEKMEEFMEPLMNLSAQISTLSEVLMPLFEEPIEEPEEEPTEEPVEEAIVVEEEIKRFDGELKNTILSNLKY